MAACLSDALARQLHDLAAQSGASPESSVLRDGVIQRFEFAFELG